MQSEMERVYKQETGKEAWESWGCDSEEKDHLRLYVEGPTVEYMKWLESRASKTEGVICSTDPCEYCKLYKGDEIDCDKWEECIEFSKFEGRKLKRV